MLVKTWNFSLTLIGRSVRTSANALQANLASKRSISFGGREYIGYRQMTYHLIEPQAVSITAYFPRGHYAIQLVVLFFNRSMTEV